MSGYDVAVVGGGAAGLTAAIEAKRQNGGLSVVILERLSRVGKKLLATGNGKCNYTNRGIGAKTYDKSFPLPGFSRFIGSFNAEEYLKTLGVFGAADTEGRVYPLSGAAASVLDGFRLELARLGIETLCDFPVEKIVPGEEFSLFSGERTVTAKAVILAGGGCSQSALGSDGSVLRIAKTLGLSADPLSPALVPLKTSAEAARGLKGIRVNAEVSLYRNGKRLKTETGEVQFGENALSGICIFNLSLLFLQDADTAVVLDLLPETENDDVLRLLRELKTARRDAALEDYLTGLFHKRIGIKLLRDCTGHALTEPVKSLSESELQRIAAQIKRMEFPILGTAGFERSQVTKGGIRPEVLNDRLESKAIPRLFVCGEMLSYAGECGGYNLTFAFASGAHTGRQCAERLSRKDPRDPAKQSGGNEKPPLTPPAQKEKKQERRKNG